MVNWEVVLWTCITIAVLLGIASMILIFISAKNLKKKREEIKTLHQEIKPGMKVMFCGAIYGKVVKVDQETVEVEVSKNTVMTVSRYALQSVE